MAQGGLIELVKASAGREVRLDRTLGPLVISWIEENLCHGPGDVQSQEIVLDDEQVAFLMAAYEITDLGRRVVRRAAYSRAKGRAKSELAAAIACVEALGPVRFGGFGEDGFPLGQRVRHPIIPCVATEEGQADNTYAAVQWMLQNGNIALMPGLDVGLTRTFLPGGGYIRPFSARASSKDGGKETFVNFDEPHLYTTEELRSLHRTIRRNLAKRREADAWSLETSTMYAPGEDSVAEATHDYAKKVASGVLSDTSLLFDHREGPSGFDFADDDQLRAALVEAYGEAAEWMDIERLIAEARDPQTDEADFRRYFLNVATKRTGGQFVADAEWAALGDGPQGIPAGAPVCIGGDGSRTYDTTVIAWAARAPDGRIDVDCRIFSVRKDVGHHELHEGGRINFEAVEDFVVDRFALFTVSEAAYDPHYLERSVEIIEARLPDARIAAVEPQSRLMREALTAFHLGVVDGTLRHRGDPAIARHVANAGVERDRKEPDTPIRRVYKIDRTKPIDAVPAMSLAAWRVARDRDRVSVYEHRDIAGPEDLAADDGVSLDEAAARYAARIMQDEDDL